MRYNVDRRYDRTRENVYKSPKVPSVSDNRVIPPKLVARVILGLESPQPAQLPIIPIDGLERLVSNSIIDICCASTTGLACIPDVHRLICPSSSKALQWWWSGDCKEATWLIVRLELYHEDGLFVLDNTYTSRYSSRWGYDEELGSIAWVAFDE